MTDSPRRHRRRLIRVIAVAEVVVALATAVTVVVAYRNLDSNIKALPEIPHLVPEPQAPGDEPRTALNVLVMGSDTRDGEGNAVDGESGGTERSDTTILLHVSADRERVYGVSIPRDTMVERPDCDVAGESVPGVSVAMWNEAFAVGGPLCTVQQVEHVTGLFVHHTVVVDFNGFRDMVDAVHGVEVCIPRDVVDPAHGISLEAGRRLVTGDEALDYVRERTVLSANGDLGRMRRQQAFVASMVDRVLSANTLSSPTRLYDFLDAATRSIALDRELASLRGLSDLALQLRATDPSHITFVTAPVEAYPADANRLQLAPAAEMLWRLIGADRPLGAFGLLGIKAGDPVGQPEAEEDTETARERAANGLCA